MPEVGGSGDGGVAVLLNDALGSDFM